VLEPRFRALLEAPDLASQRDVFDRRLDLPLVRGLFRVAFTPRVFAKRGMDPRSLQFHDPNRSLGVEYFARFRDMCTESPARANPYLQLFTMGEVVYPEALPAFLTPRGATVLRSDPGAVRFVDADITRHLATEAAGAYDRFHLSNVTDWLPPDAFDQLLATIAGRCARPARIVWRAIHVDRMVPDTLTGTITTNREWGQQLRAHDRFPIYAIVPATVE
jgi:S-adenosylmethionine:diacylglycerol 3-amino-3-carboxypropyl transferase